MANKRTAPRIEVSLPVRWEGVLDQREATVTNLSVDGCFVLSGGDVTPQELISLEIELPNQAPVYCWGEVTDRANEIGFAVRFTTLDEAEQQRLADFISLRLEIR